MNESNHAATGRRENPYQDLEANKARRQRAG
jgi:hypothetical protein